MKSVCYIVSDVHKSLGFEWVALGLKDKYDLTFLLLNPIDTPLEQFLKTNGIRVMRISYHGKSNFVAAFWKTLKLLRQLKPDVVHAHLLDAQLIGLTAARMTGIRKRVYTRHNSNFHHAYFPRGVKYDRWSNNLSTHVVSISQATDYTLRTLEGVVDSKIRKIPHGFDFDTFTNVSPSLVDEVRHKWKIPAGRLVIGVVARHIEWKGIQYIIPAFRTLLETHPTAVLVLANASGPYHKTIEESISDLGDSVIQVPFENNVAALYKTFSIYVHTPTDPVIEAFGQTYVEALAVGLPAVFTLSGIGREFIKDGENALVVGYKNSEEIAKALLRLSSDESLRDRLRNKGKEDVFLHFGIARMIAQLEQLYDE